jgi:hypothetical protein
MTRKDPGTGGASGAGPGACWPSTQVGGSKFQFGEIGHFGMWIAEELARVTIHPTSIGKTARAELVLFDQPTIR